MPSILKRTLSGIVYVALIVLSILFTQWAFPLLCLLFGILGMLEFRKLTSTVGTPWAPAFMLDLAVAVVALAVVLIPVNQTTLTALALLYPFVRLLMELYHKSATPLTNVGCSFVSVVWIILPLLALQELFAASDRMLVLTMFVMIWLNDTGAFCAGSLFGRRRLFERISPKKSWEGFWGGLAVSAIFGYFAPALFPQIALTPLQSLGLGATVSVAATYGDLVESMFKRALHVKDSGNIMPGHGGILDRIDSLLFVAPATLLFIALISF